MVSSGLGFWDISDSGNALSLSSPSLSFLWIDMFTLLNRTCLLPEVCGYDFLPKHFTVIFLSQTYFYSNSHVVRVLPGVLYVHDPKWCVRPSDVAVFMAATNICLLVRVNAPVAGWLTTQKAWTVMTKQSGLGTAECLSRLSFLPLLSFTFLAFLFHWCYFFLRGMIYDVSE